MGSTLTRVSPFELDVENLVLIANLGERQRNRRAAVADALFTIDLLRLVQVTEGDVTDARPEQAGGQRFGVADDQAALGVFRHRTAGHVRVADSDQRLTWFALGIGGFDQPFVNLTDTAQVVVAQVRAGHFGGSQERQRQAPGDGFALGIRQWQQQALGVELTVIQPQHTTQRMRAQTPHQRRGQFNARTGIVVAGDHHDGQLRLLFMGADDEVVEAFLGFDRRVDRVEDIAGDQQHVWLVQLQLAQQPFEKAGVFEIALLAVQVLPEVPVGGVKQTQGELRRK